MDKEKLPDKIQKNASVNTIEDDEELAFIEYQEMVNHSKEAKRNRLLLIALSTAVYLLGLGLFATIVDTLYKINEIVGIVVGLVLLVSYTICYIVILCQIFSKHSFDIEQKNKKNHKFSERRNNTVRFEMARSIKDQSAVLDYLEKESNKTYLSKDENAKIDSFQKIISLANKYPNSTPSYHSEDAKELAKALQVAMSKDGVIYKKAKAIIMKRALATGCLTALSQNAVMDMSIVAVKDMQLIKDLIWLYGFRPSNYEMNKIMLKVLKNVCISIGLNTIPKNANLLSKVFNKDSNNFLIQLFGQVLDMGAQFLGNGTMTYLIGRYTIKVLLKQYHLQDILRTKALEEYELDLNKATIEEINKEIDEEMARLSTGKAQIEDEKPLQLEDEKKKGFLHHLFQKKDKEKTKK